MKAKKAAYWFMFAIFCLSFFLLCFAGWNIYWENRQANETLKEWENLMKYFDQAQLEDDLNIAGLVQVNDLWDIKDADRIDPNSNVMKLDRASFSINRKEGDLIGKLTIPALNRELPIIYGTGDKELAKGVGHYIGSALPGENDNSVLSGHRQTVFRDLGSVEVGDEFIVETLDGEFTYQVFDMFIVDKDDRGVIVPHDSAILTLVTCYPFNFIGAAPERYILQAKLIDKPLKDFDDNILK